MEEIKAIETEYNGYKFRSRLEARWAVFFDALGIEYQYEPEGFDLGDGIWYLPDFYLKNVCRRGWNEDEKEKGVWVEAKGEITENDIEKIERFSKFQPIIVLPDIPKDYWEWQDKWERGEKSGLYNSYGHIDGDDYCAFFSIYNGEPWITGMDHDTWDFGEALNPALKKARQARFEHGEKPKV